MSLDKYVMRGFTSSTGSSTGSWIAKAEAPQNNQTPSDNSGTSFVMGGMGGGARAVKSKGSARNKTDYRDPDHTFDRQDIQFNGAGSRREVPANCFGGRRDSGEPRRACNSNIVVGVWMGLIAVVVFLIAFYQPSSKRVATEWRERRIGTSR